MTTQLNLDSDVKKLSQTQLDELRQMCWDKDAEISKEISRRASMLFIWETELSSVRMIRSAMKNDPQPFAEWKKPSSIVDAYIVGDSVTYKGARYLATGSGALMYAPDEVDPIQGVTWFEQVDGESSGTGVPEAPSNIVYDPSVSPAPEMEIGSDDVGVSNDAP